MMHSVRLSNFVRNLSSKTYLWVGLTTILVVIGSGCSRKEMPYHGFNSSGSLEQSDNYVLAESIGGKLDPRNMSQDDQRYSHDNIAYDRNEEGYFQWGKKLYALGYRDEEYVRELAPRAFRKDLLDTYDKALREGFEEAQEQASK